MIIILIVILIFIQQIIYISGKIFSNFIEKLPFILPGNFIRSSESAKKLIHWRQRWVISKHVKHSTGLAVPVAVNFFDCRALSPEKKKRRFVVLRNPKAHPDENLANIVYSLVDRHLNREDFFADSQLRSLLRALLFRDLIENCQESGLLSQDRRERVLRHAEYPVAKNPYFSIYQPIVEKRLFSGLYVQTISRLMQQPLSEKEKANMPVTLEQFGQQLAEVAGSLTDRNMVELEKKNNNFYIGGLRLNLLFVRQFNKFRNADIVQPAKDLEPLMFRGLRFNFVICGGFPFAELSPRDYRRRLRFAKKVTYRMIYLLPELELLGETRQAYHLNGKNYPIYVAALERTSQGRRFAI